MTRILDSFSLRAFDRIAARKGYSFRQVLTPNDLEAVTRLSEENGVQLPDEQKTAVVKFRRSVINFVAYHKGAPVGMASLSDPNRSGGRAYEKYGVDQAGKYYDIQGLSIKTGHETSLIVALGLFRQMYDYSRRNDICYWNSNGARNVYQAMRRYCQEIQQIDIDFASIKNPLTQFLVTKKITATNFTLEVNSIEPWKVFKKFVSNSFTGIFKKMQNPRFSTPKTLHYGGLGISR